MVIEASYSWRPTYRRLEELGLEVKLTHPHKVRAIAEAKIKTDSIDARSLAHLLRADLIPESYVLPEEIRKLRGKVRLRAKLGRERSRMKCKIRAELEKNRITTLKNPFTMSGKEKLREMGIEPVDHYLAVLGTIEERIEMLEDEFEGIAEDDEEAKLLMIIPGISHFSALLILSEIGDIERFSSPEKLCSYDGLVPTIHQSGENVRMGSLKKEGSGLLRWILVESIWIHIGNADSQLSRYYDRKKEEKESKRAAIATANKMLTTIYWILKRGEEYQPEG